MADFLSTEQVSERLGVALDTVQLLARNRRLPFVKVGRRYLIPVQAWEQWVAEQGRQALAAVTAQETLMPDNDPQTRVWELFWERVFAAQARAECAANAARPNDGDADP